MKIVRVSGLYKCDECPIISASDGCLCMQDNKCPLEEGIFITLKKAEAKNKPIHKSPINEVPEEFKEEPIEEKKISCPECGAKMTEREGPYGKFWGCSRFPLCRGKRKGVTNGN